MTVKVRSRKHFFQVIYRTPYQRSSSGKGCLLLKVVFHQRSSSVKLCLPSKVVFHQIIRRDSPNVVCFICTDSPYIVHFKCRYCPYIVHFKHRDCIYVYSLRPGPSSMASSLMNRLTHIVKELNVNEFLKYSIFVIQKHQKMG